MKSVELGLLRLMHVDTNLRGDVESSELEMLQCPNKCSIEGGLDDVWVIVDDRLYQNSCKKFSRSFVKDLWNLGRDLTKVVIVDDKPYSYILQPENAIPIIPFTDDLGDDELKKLMSGFFTRCHEFEDLRDAVKHYVGNGVAYSNCIEKLSEDMWG
ncbi:phosphatase Herzog-like [Helianthus annuus]|uniref:phosphatase Herzog-like n=1 Tax=Helianthus annuus TaxID=4232 RepID=UPI001652FF3B|nr:phosphatase Herzog-like [Helianthus annuus]